VPLAKLYCQECRQATLERLEEQRWGYVALQRYCCEPRANFTNSHPSNGDVCREIFNTDQGCQFSSAVFTSALTAVCVRISMGHRGRWMDNVFIELGWRLVAARRWRLCAKGSTVECLKRLWT
jgi:hypothetical protein